MTATNPQGERAVTYAATEVRNIMHSRDGFDVYIGRDFRGRKDIGWGNPFVIGHDGNRYEVIAKYRAWILTQPHLLARLHELRGQRLGCWCAPLSCHGHVLAELADAGRVCAP